MALTQAQQLFAMYVIGEVESNWNWTSVNYNDPITLGMMQWYGTRAAGMLERVQAEDAEGFAMLAESLRASLSSHPSSDRYWNSRYLDQTEGDSWVRAAQRDQNHAIQQNQFFEDLQGYLDVISGWGVPDSNVKETIFICCMYHQSPAACGRVVGSAGGSANLDLLYSTCLNNGVLGSYRNRYGTAYNRLKSWDGTSAPPDFGQVGDVPAVGGEGGGTSTTQTNNLFTHARVMGDTLVVYGRDQYASGIIFRHFGGGLFKPAVNKTGEQPSEDAGNTGGGTVPPGDAGTGQKIMEWVYARKGKFRYAQAPGRLDPDHSGLTDCSGLVWSAYHAITGQEVGTSTKGQLDAARAAGKLVAQGGYGEQPPWDQMQAADIMVMDLRGYVGNYAECDHVELYTGDGHFWGQRGGYGPTQWSVTSETFATAVNKWYLIRWL